MQGLGGNDSYVVDNAGDKVLEAVGGGVDRVASSVSYALAAGQEIERLDTTSTAGTTAINLTGNEFGQAIIGNVGANTLDGKGGADTMQGLGGNDFYVVDNAGDKVLEAVGGGVDRVASSVSYTLAAGQEIERLDTTSTAGTTAINLTGNEFGQAIIGNAGANTLDGKGGADTMQGLGGNDFYVVDNAGDKVLEAVGGGVDRVASSVSYTLAAGQEIERLDTTSTAGTMAINLTGNEFGQAIIGNVGANTLDGKGGADTMQGLGGNDFYVVDNAGDKVLEAVGGGVDRVASSVSYTLAAGQEIERLDTTSTAGTTAINLTGNEFGQAIIGNAGANTLDGKGGADTMQGLGGNDSYVVDNAGDKVLEAVGGGVDRVASSVSYALAAGQEIERLDTTSTAGTTAINLTGNEFGQAIIGNVGANTLDGKGGADTMQGLGGNDFYVVDNAGDKVLEAVGGGVDRVASSVSYTLAAGQEIERLDTTTSTAGTTAINLTGNEFGQAIIGNAGANTLDGKGGADTMQGLGGNDFYVVDNAGDKVLEAVGGGVDRVASSVSYALASGQEIERLDTTSTAGTTAINLTGNEFGQAIIGNAGANVLNGGGGADTLQGLGGSDTFVFRSGETQGDVILDFGGHNAGAGDSIRLEGYGTIAEGAAFVQLDATHWQVNSADGLIHETLTFTNAAAIHASDVLFA
ncbi:Ca2+-binding RTX toxin-like protein [Bradyrhizobium sp. LB7.2]